MRAFLFAACAVAFLVVDIRAADKVSIPVYTDPSMTDADFPLQGEYLGYQRSQPMPGAANSSGCRSWRGATGSLRR